MGQNVFTIPEMFIAAAIYTASASTIFYIIYWVIGRKLEKKLVQKNEEERLKIENKLKIEKVAEAYLPGLQGDFVSVTAM